MSYKKHLKFDFGVKTLKRLLGLIQANKRNLFAKVLIQSLFFKLTTIKFHLNFILIVLILKFIDKTLEKYCKVIAFDIED